MGKSSFCRIILEICGNISGIRIYYFHKKKSARVHVHILCIYMSYVYACVCVRARVCMCARKDGVYLFVGLED